MVPAVFAGGAKPSPIPASLYGDAPVTAPPPPPQATSPPPLPTAPSAPADGVLVSLDVIRVEDQSRVGSFLVAGDGRVAAGVVEVDLSAGGVNLEAVTTGPVSWVQFRVDGVIARHEQHRPYLLGPGVAGDAQAWKVAARGKTYAVRVAAKTAGGAVAYGTWSVKFV